MLFILGSVLAGVMLYEHFMEHDDTADKKTKSDTSESTSVI